MKLASVPPVAVRIDRDTVRPGEGVALAFRGRPETRFFGETTFGAATSTFPCELSGGAYFAAGTMADGKGKEYPTASPPTKRSSRKPPSTPTTP